MARLGKLREIILVSIMSDVHTELDVDVLYSTYRIRVIYTCGMH